MESHATVSHIKLIYVPSTPHISAHLASSKMLVVSLNVGVETQRGITHVNVNIGVDSAYTVGASWRNEDDEVHCRGINHLQREHSGVLRVNKK